MGFAKDSGKSEVSQSWCPFLWWSWIYSEEWLFQHLELFSIYMHKIVPSKVEKNHQSHVHSSICFHESIKPGWKEIRDELIWLGGLMETFRWEKIRAEGRYKNKGLLWRNSPLSLASYITDHHNRFCKISPSVKALSLFLANISNMWKRLIFMEKKCSSSCNKVQISYRGATGMESLSNDYHLAGALLGTQ